MQARISASPANAESRSMVNRELATESDTNWSMVAMFAMGCFIKLPQRFANSRNHGRRRSRRTDHNRHRGIWQFRVGPICDWVRGRGETGLANVADNPDDFIWQVFILHVNYDPLAKRISAGEILFGESLVDDHHVGLLSEFPVVEHAPPQQRNVHSAEVISRDDAYIRSKGLAVRTRRLADDRKIRSGADNGKRRSNISSRGYCSGKRADSSEKL